MNCIFGKNTAWRKKLRYVSIAGLLVAVFLPFFLGAHQAGQEEKHRRLSVRVYLSSPADTTALHELGLKRFVERSKDYVDVSVSGKQLLELRQRGYEVALIVEVDTSGTAPAGWPSVEQIEQRIFELARTHPEICHVFPIGKSAFHRRSIWALKISDEPEQEEDEPSVLFTGGMHAREPLGILACLRVAEELVRGYGRKPAVTEWVRETQIFVVPLVNPDGYDYILSEHVRFPWWRKNLEDNDGDGAFDPRVDGVDLNRNFAFNWSLGGDGRPSSWFYRGPRPFSEPETQAIRDLATQVRPVAGISFHSHGEAVLYPWTNFSPPVDEKLIRRMAAEMARVAGASKGGHYEVYPLNGRVGQSSCWLYGALSCLDFTVEVGDQYFPQIERVPRLVGEAVKTAFYLLDRVRGTGLSLKVVDGVTQRPLVAAVWIEELGEGPGARRHTDPFFGRYRCLLEPGTYTLRIEAPRHALWRDKVTVAQGKRLDLNVVLTPAEVTASTERE